MKRLMVFMLAFVFSIYFPDLAIALTPDIKANGSNKAIQINSDDNLRITIGLDTENQNTNADWWIVYENNGQWFSYVLPQNWISGISHCIQYNVFEFNDFPVMEKSLSPGDYTFYFGIDTNPNTILDTPLYFDYINVYVEETKTSILDHNSGHLTTTVVSDARNCGEGIIRYTRTFEFTKNGNQVTFYGKDFDYDSFVLQGQITGNEIKISGSYNDDVGVTTMSGSVTVSGYSFAGTLNWTWKNHPFSCSGSDQVSGYMQ